MISSVRPPAEKAQASVAETEALIGGVTGAGAETGLIVARNVHKRYGRKRILNGVELTVPQGKVMALLGANGAGKSTLMRIISGLATPDRGEVRLGSVNARPTMNPALYRASMRRCYDNLSAWDNLMFYAQLDIQQPAVRRSGLTPWCGRAVRGVHYSRA
jgi:ABC-type multidrug transport system ATPase subunit